ncbi:lysophospholipid acyltransferase family protein [Roseospirillum parvum]|uniref:1-acyl-sn-glycerol-3-phosphate acyltransferase n=1 Tax=Roseospirillum parvum TaxID=83401 RepID=A0A1G8DN07_9PROT|nr:lysophospholipid acyltransferase family protein [Roseospirillum parvum]SDH58889.1 1-acyl-sn-glycerol-3-phosphate acyltransferase [Roseospirillum parvum]
MDDARARSAVSETADSGWEATGQRRLFAPRLGSTLGAAARLLAFAAFTVLFIPPYWAVMRLGGPYRSLARFYWQAVGRIIQLEIKVHGEVCGKRPLLCVANHTSYADIVVLGSLIPGAFVSKAEVAGWPGFGLIAKLGRTVFVERKRTRTGDQMAEIRRRFADGEPLILFPEGTSSDGNRVLPFKSALFAVAEAPHDGQPVSVQPVSLAYTRLDGLPLGLAWRPFVAWYGDMDLAPHLWALLGLGRKRAEVVFHPPVEVSDFANRKALAEACRARVASGVSAALAGRLDPVAESAGAEVGATQGGLPPVVFHHRPRG